MSDDSVMAALGEYRDYIVEMFNTGMIHADIALNISRMGVQRGCSVRSVRGFCEQNNLSRWGHSNSDLEMAVTRAINLVRFILNFFFFFVED